MAKCNKITKNTAHKLKCAYAIACEMRLRVYNENKTQMNLKLMPKDIKSFLNIVGETSTINFFQIAFCLQFEIAKQLNLNFCRLHFYSNPQAINLAIGLVFEIDGMVNLVENSQANLRKSSTQYDIDERIEHLESNCKLNFESRTKKLSKEGSKTKPKVLQENVHYQQSHLKPKQILIIANSLKSLEEFDEALELYKHWLDAHKNYSNYESNKLNEVAEVNF